MKCSEGCGYFWKEEWEKYPSCHYPYDDDYAPCSYPEESDDDDIEYDEWD